MKRMLIIDGNSIVNRAFYGVRPLTTSDGLHTNAVFGMINIILKNMELTKPDICAAAFDLPHPTFRHEKYPLYKANRKGAPDELRMQFPFAKQCLSAMGIGVIEKEGYEADDILGTLSTRADEAGDIQTYILTGDRDALQLITETTSVLLAQNTETTVFDGKKFSEVYGVTPHEYIDVKALMGDSSDNIPGVPGIGEKTAFKLIAAYKSLGAFYSALDGKAVSEVGKSALQKLSDGRESAYLSRFLAEIDKNVPLDGLPPLYNGIVKDELFPLLTRLEMFSFIKKFSADTSAAPAAENISHEYLRVGESELSALPADTVFSVMLTGTAPEDTVRLTDGKIYYETNYSLAARFLADPGRRFTMHDCKNYCGVVACCFDTMLAAYVLAPEESDYSIPRLAARYLGSSPDSTCEPCETNLKLYTALGEKLTESGQSELFYNIEMPLASVLHNMETRGFKVDRHALGEFSERLTALLAQNEEKIYSLSSCVFNINSPKQLGDVLFEKLGLPTGKKTKTGYSTNAEVLERLRPYHPIIDSILEYRQVAKLKATYVDGLLAAADANGRVHTSFNQTVTATGRLSSSEPNLQNIPIRQPMGRELRRSFVPESNDYLLIDADYSQVELRILAHIADDKAMIAAFESGTDIHTVTASQVFDVPESEVTPEMRKRAKAVNFGIVYGISDFSLAADLHVSKYEAGLYIKHYLEHYSGVADYLKKVVEDAKVNSYVTTVFGRRRYIPELKAGKAALRSFGERVAMNSPIQGAAADIIKMAMIEVERRLTREGLDAHLILQVHDELVVEANKGCAEAAAEILRDSMENIVSLSVPLTVDLTVGENWYK